MRPLLFFSWVLGLVLLLFAASRLWGAVGRELFVDYPAVTRLLDAGNALLALAAAWAAVRDPRTGSLIPLCLVSVALWNVLELPIGALLGSVLLSLSAVALWARPWPHRVIVARCIGLAAIAVAIASAVGALK